MVNLNFDIFLCAKVSEVFRFLTKELCKHVVYIYPACGFVLILNTHISVLN